MPTEDKTTPITDEKVDRACEALHRSGWIMPVKIGGTLYMPGDIVRLIRRLASERDEARRAAWSMAGGKR